MSISKTQRPAETTWLPRAALFSQRSNPSLHSDECLLLLMALSGLLLVLGRRSSRGWLSLGFAARSAAATTAALHFATTARATAVALLFATAALRLTTAARAAAGLTTTAATARTVAREHAAEETTAAAIRTMAAAERTTAGTTAAAAATTTARTTASTEEGVRGAGEGQHGHDQSNPIETHFLNLHLRTQMPASDVRLVAEPLSLAEGSKKIHCELREASNLEN